jgi:hypothetical protein
MRKFNVEKLLRIGKGLLFLAEALLLILKTEITATFFRKFGEILLR